MGVRWTSFVIPVSLLAIWEVTSRAGVIDTGAFSMPSAIVLAGWQATMSGEVLVRTWQTLEAAVYGMAVATVVGVAVGVFLGFQPYFEKMSRILFEIARAIPAIALMPLALLVYGFGINMEASIVAYACVWPIIIAAMAATRNIDTRLLEVAAVLEMKPARRYFSIILPAVFARVMVGVRTAIGFALVVSVTIEILANPRGLGYGLIIAQQSFNTPLMYAYLFWLALVGLAINEISKLGSNFSERGN